VKCIGVDEKGRVKLSRKAAMEERGEIPPSTGAPEEGAPAASEGEARPERAERPERGGDRGGDRGPRGGDRGGRGGDRGADRGGRGERGGRRGDAPAGGEGEGSGEPLEIGKIYRAKVVTIKDFGSFVEFLPGREGLVHVSELANFRVKQVEDIVQLGDEIWVKLWGNLAFNPISALTTVTLDVLTGDPGQREVARTMMLEAQAIGEALGVRFGVDVDKRIAGAAEVGVHKTSMLQDLERGRPMEIDALLGVVVELAELTGLPAPTCRTVLALARARARAAGCY
jgi:predicted RNA-binding protein with RPS1 domain